MQNFHVSFPGLGIHDLPISRVAFSFSVKGLEFNIYWYGIMFAVGFFLSLVLALRHCKRYDLSKDNVLDVYLAVVPLSIIGARLYYVAFTWDFFKNNLLSIFNTRYGGLAFYGGVIGGIFAMWLVSRIRKIPLSKLLDFFVPYLALGQAIGRWGNFFNQEAFGVNTNLPWGMISEGTTRYLSQFGTAYAPLSPVHPTFLYEFIGNLLIFAFLLYRRRNRNFAYEVTAWYITLYGCLRFFVEGLRTDALFIPHTTLRVSRVLSAVMFVVGIIWLVAGEIKRRKEDAEYEKILAAEADRAEKAKAEAELTAANEPGADTESTAETVSSDETEQNSAAEPEEPSESDTINEQEGTVPKTVNEATEEMK